MSAAISPKKNRVRLGPSNPHPRSAESSDEEDRSWMRKALALARRGRGSTRPNPMVGAVVVRKGRLLGQGFHRRVGESHAEVNALGGLGKSAAGATVYVTLEPCCHTGRTAPCTDALIAAGVARVVVAVRDPNPLVDGRGVTRLRRAGIRVDVGCLGDECAALNRPFFCWVSLGRPLVTLKVAATLDGFIADRGVAVNAARGRATPRWITSALARAAGHELRAAHDAILVGAGTVRADDPRLTVRLSGARGQRRDHRTPTGAGPLRVILDGRLGVPVDSVVLSRVKGDARTLVFGAAGAAPARVLAIETAGAEVVLLPGRVGRIDLRRVLRELAKRDVQSLLIEGGAQVHAAFIAAGLVDRVAFFYAPRLMGGGVPIAAGTGLPLSRSLRLGPFTARPVGPDLLIGADVLH